MEINKVSNANVYVDGNNHLGQAESVELPKITVKMKEQETLGLFGKVELPDGIEKMEAKIVWNSLYPGVLKKVANPFKSVALQVRSSLEIYDSNGRLSEKPIVVQLRGTFKEFPTGTYKQHESVTVETPLAISYMKVTIDGEDIVEVDVPANIYKAGGENILSTTKANIGG